MILKMKDMKKKERTKRDSNLFEILLKNRNLIILLIIFSFGMVTGSLLLRNSGEIVSKITELFDTYREIRNNQTFIETFCNSLLIYFSMILFAFCCGLCAVGLPGILLMPLFKGFGAGLVFGYLYSQYSLNGLGYSLLLMFPGSFFSTISLFMCCDESLNSSYNIFNTISSGTTTPKWEGLKIYTARYVFFVLISVFAAVLDAVLNQAFSTVFVLAR